MVFRAVTLKYSGYSRGGIGPTMEIEAFIESYTHVESIYYKFGP